MAWFVNLMQPSLLVISSIYLFVIMSYWSGITPSAPSVRNYSFVAVFGFLAAIVNFVNVIWLSVPKKWLNWLFVLLLLAAVVAYPIYLFKFMIPAIKGCKEKEELDLQMIDPQPYHDGTEMGDEFEKWDASYKDKIIHKRIIIEPGTYDCSQYGDVIIEPIHFALQVVNFFICLSCMVAFVCFDLCDMNDSTSCLGCGTAGPGATISKTEIVAVKRDV